MGISSNMTGGLTRRREARGIRTTEGPLHEESARWWSLQDKGGGLRGDCPY